MGDGRSPDLRVLGLLLDSTWGVGGGFRNGRTPRSGLLQDGKPQAAGFPSVLVDLGKLSFLLPRAASRELPSKGPECLHEMQPPAFLLEGLGWSEGTDTQDRDRNLPAQVGAAERILSEPRAHRSFFWGKNSNKSSEASLLNGAATPVSCLS